MTPAPAKGLPQRFNLSSFLFNAAGRSSRTAFLVGGFLVPLAVGFAQMALDGAMTGGWGRTAVDALFQFALLVLTGVAVTRRLHDLSLSGWWFAPLYFLAMATPAQTKSWAASSPPVGAQPRLYAAAALAREGAPEPLRPPARLIDAQASSRRS